MAQDNVDLQDHLNRMTPAADDVKLGDLLQEIITAHNALLKKMDTDFTAQNVAVAASQLDVNYESAGKLTDVNNR